jgi:integrase
MAWIEERKRQHRTAYKVYWRDPSGKVRTKTFARSADAKRYAREVEHRKDTGSYVDPAAGNITLAEAFDHMMTTATHLRPSTRELYAMHGRLYLAGGSLGDRPIRTIGKGDVRTFLAELSQTKGAATVDAVKRLLHRILEVAVEEDRITRNPAHGVRVERPARREVRFLTEDEVARIAGEVPDRYRTLVWTLAISGLRIGEASAVRVRNLDLKARTIHVVESSSEVAGVKITGATKTGQSRVVDIPAELATMLTDHLERFGNRFAKDSWVFAGPDGGQIRQNGFRQRIFQPAAERAGITPTPTVHDLRHTAASFMARAGLSLVEAAGQLGHSTTAMTARYSHVFPSERQAKMSDLGALIVQTWTSPSSSRRVPSA